MIPGDFFITETSKPGTGRVVLAFILDLFTAFFAFGFLVASATGGMTDQGFALEGAPALVAFALIGAYMYFMPRFGGRLWQRILKTR